MFFLHLAEVIIPYGRFMGDFIPSPILLYAMLLKNRIQDAGVTM